MRIECHSIEDFLENLRDQTVFQKTVYINKTARSLTDEPVRKSTSVEVIIQASAVIQYDGGEGDALVECGESCGVDRTTGDGDLEGTNTFVILNGQIETFCDQNGLTIKPGILGI